MNLAKYIGLPYAPQGRSRQHVDCYGLVYVVYRDEIGVVLPTYTDDYDDPDNSEEVSQAIERHAGSWKKVLVPQVLDVLVFNMRGLPAHCGLYIGNGDFLHSMKGTATCIERLNSITWAKRLAGCYRWEA